MCWTPFDVGLYGGIAYIIGTAVTLALRRILR